VRKETILTAAKLLLDIDCELLLNLFSRSGPIYVSSEDYTWLEQRFGPGATHSFYYKDLVSKAVAEFRAVVDLNDDSVAQLLVEHIRNRIEEAFDALEFIVGNTHCPDIETAIHDSYGFNKVCREQRGLPHIKTEDLQDRHSINFLTELTKRLAEITDGRDRFEAFEAFSILESSFEPVEESVQKLAAEVDRMIQMQIDIAGGK
jgi:hypothetical protein